MEGIREDGKKTRESVDKLGESVKNEAEITRIVIQKNSTSRAELKFSENNFMEENLASHNLDVRPKIALGTLLFHPRSRLTTPLTGLGGRDVLHQEALHSPPAPRAPRRPQPEALVPGQAMRGPPPHADVPHQHLKHEAASIYW